MGILVLHIEDSDVSLGEATIELNRDIHAGTAILKAYNIALSSTFDASAGTDVNDFMCNIDVEWAVSGRYSIQGTSKNVTGIPIFIDMGATNATVSDYNYVLNVRNKHIPKVFKMRFTNADGTLTRFWPGTTTPTPNFKITLVFEISEIIKGV